MKVRGSVIRLGLDDGRDIGDRTNQRALMHGGDDTLHINYRSDFEGGTIIGSNLTVDGTITGGNLTVDGTIESGAITAARINRKSLSGTGLTCTDVVEEGSSTNDAITSVGCGNGYTMTGCSCFGPWANCDGSFIEDNICKAQAAGPGDWIRAMGRCCKVH